MKKLLILNWKENPSSISVACSLFKKTAYVAKKLPVVVVPPFVFLSAIKDLKKKNSLILGAQDVSIFSGGAFTGDISATMLKSVGVSYCIVGHSERRRYYNETCALIAKKIIALQDNSIVPILCVGEKKRMAPASAYRIVAGQMKRALSSVDKKKTLVVAYEPVWSIGGDKPTDDVYANAVMEKMRAFLRDFWQGSFVVIYGGSVSPNTIDSFLGDGGADGFLVGSASLRPLDVAKIIKKIYGKK